MLTVMGTDCRGDGGVVVMCFVPPLPKASKKDIRAQMRAWDRSFPTGNGGCTGRFIPVPSLKSLLLSGDLACCDDERGWDWVGGLFPMETFLPILKPLYKGPFGGGFGCDVTCSSDTVCLWRSV